MKARKLGEIVLIEAFAEKDSSQTRSKATKK
jgi:hypothetical protein